MIAKALLEQDDSGQAAGAGTRHATPGLALRAAGFIHRTMNKVRPAR
jgi:hypothetical protein